jgi:DNA (cytosine-5)-methyltransferase 1
MSRAIQPKALSLFSGAGGFDVGISGAGFENVWANDFDPAACKTYALNHNGIIRQGDIRDYLNELRDFEGIDLLHGGPPCQGFSVAGKMDPNDPRSQLVWEFCNAVRVVRPKAFVCENVSALGRLEKWSPIRERLLREFREAGYDVAFTILKAYEFGVPQKRERVFFIGLRDTRIPNHLVPLFDRVKRSAPKLRDILLPLGEVGSPTNQGVCNAKITIAQSPVLRRSPYAGMLFNGLGRPLNPEDYASTMHASMGGNKTPFVDMLHLHGKATSWVEEYHAKLMRGEKPLPLDSAPDFLRRLTVTEAKLIQTFPADYEVFGRTSAQFRQIGNAVPCRLAEAVGKVVMRLLYREQSRPDSTDGELALIAC